MKCLECYYFEPCFVMECGGCPAFCGHPDCFEPVIRQTFEGGVYKDKTRVKDIVDFNPDGKCSRWASFHYETVKWWWVFGKQIKVKNKRKEK